MDGFHINSKWLTKLGGVMGVGGCHGVQMLSAAVRGAPKGL